MINVSTSPDLIRETFEQYSLSVPTPNGDVSVWPIFWHHGDHEHEGFYGGKASPDALKEALADALEADYPQFESEDQIREYLFEKGLGVDCSGFAFHSLDTLFKEHDAPSLSESLLVPVSDVVVAAEKPHWQQAYELSDDDVNRFSLSGVPVSWISEQFERPPEMLVGADVLTNRLSARGIARAGDVRPLDVLRMQRNGGLHAAVVADVAGGRIEYWDCGGAISGGLGSVRQRFVEIPDPDVSVASLPWPESIAQFYTIEATRLRIIES